MPAAKFQGKSFRPVLENEQTPGQTEVYASHSLHEITMYYPMRVIRTKQYKLIYNIAAGLAFPMALDLEQSSAWQSVLKANKKEFGKRLIKNFRHRPQFELYDLIKDPDELYNLANNKKYEEIFEELLAKLKQFQQDTRYPWVHKWRYE